MFRRETIYILLLLFCHAALVQAQQSTDTRLRALENKVSLLEQSAQAKATELDGKFANKAGEMENKMRENLLAQREEFFWAKAVAITGGSVSVIAVIIAIISFARKIHVIAEQKAQEKFDALFDRDKDKLLALIKQQDIDTQLREQKRIIVLHAADADLSFLKRFFDDKDQRFKQIEYKRIDDYTPSPEHDLVFFHNDNGDLDKTEIVKIAGSTPSRAVCFYFGPGRVDTLGDLDRRFAFANARTQLYGNLMNALRYQKLLL